MRSSFAGSPCFIAEPTEFHANSGPHRKPRALSFVDWQSGGLTLYWEPRGGWDATQVKYLCEKFAIFHAVDPFLNETVTPDNLYFRLHGGAGFRHKYSDEELRELALKLSATNAEACVFFNNLSMIDDATRFGELMSLVLKKI